jgi:hypothetical protein
MTRVSMSPIYVLNAPEHGRRPLLWLTDNRSVCSFFGQIIVYGRARGVNGTLRARQQRRSGRTGSGQLAAQPPGELRRGLENC